MTPDTFFSVKFVLLLLFAQVKRISVFRLWDFPLPNPNPSSALAGHLLMSKSSVPLLLVKNFLQSASLLQLEVKESYNQPGRFLGTNWIVCTFPYSNSPLSSTSMNIVTFVSSSIDHEIYNNIWFYAFTAGSQDNNYLT